MSDCNSSLSLLTALSFAVSSRFVAQSVRIAFELGIWSNPPRLVNEFIFASISIVLKPLSLPAEPLLPCRLDTLPRVESRNIRDTYDWCKRCKSQKHWRQTNTPSPRGQSFVGDRRFPTRSCSLIMWMRLFSLLWWGTPSTIEACDCMLSSSADCNARQVSSWGSDSFVSHRLSNRILLRCTSARMRLCLHTSAELERFAVSGWHAFCVDVFAPRHVWMSKMAVTPAGSQRWY